MLNMNEVKNKSYIECPKCGEQASIKSASSIFFSAGAILQLAGGCLLRIPVLGWIGAPITFILGTIFLVIGIIAVIVGGAVIQCSHCNSTYNLTKSEYKKFKKSVK